MPISAFFRAGLHNKFGDNSLMFNKFIFTETNHRNYRRGKVLGQKSILRI